DKDKVQKELDLQREVSQEFSKNMQATSAFINSKKDKLKEELKQENLSPEQRAQYEKELAQWNSGGLILNAIGAGLAAPTNSMGGILAATASPAISHQIGQYFKGKDAEGSTAHLVAHAVLGAAVAAAGGNNALAGGLAAAGAEATAPIVSKWLYGKNAKDLTADEKATVSAIAGLTGAATGVAVGGSMADVAQGNQAGHTAVDNNQLAINHNQSDKKAIDQFNQKVKKELGNKFELRGTGELNLLGYEIMELVPIGDNTINSLSQAELDFYNMLNNVIKDPTGTAQMILVYDDDKVAGGSWKYNKFDVADMEKLDKNHIILSGNVLIAHELYEQIEKDKLGLKAGQGTQDKNFENFHIKAVDKEGLVLPPSVELVEERGQVNGKIYDKLYYDKVNKKMYGISIGQFITDSSGMKHIFNPEQQIIKPNKNGRYRISNPNNPNQYFDYP
ncbi:VENN motif pre-toxin domain-containing protein, partial [Snodgrassella communis]|uniref:VENN motif pre-toxin domain-containing protein n=1 Tax=Snodgrassella communis TaxID=2946699 RepID=UPI0015D55C84